MYLDEKIVAVEHAMLAAGIPHAFGGANAFAYYGTPRATVDIDVNVFVDAERVDDVLAALTGLGIELDEAAVRPLVARDGQARIFWDRTPIDLFFSYDPLHLSSMERRRRVDFGEDRIHILSAEDLIVYKVVFDREKDWRDIAEMIHAANQSLDYGYVRDWLGRIVEPEGAQLTRLERLIDSGGRELDGAGQEGKVA
ncbi:MAG: hypothetical protein QF570_15930 [Myxococcota bacterium]|jgi:hypothetical protein|nr:hypothetical protein [Myxococcota bacterium]